MCFNTCRKSFFLVALFLVASCILSVLLITGTCFPKQRHLSKQWKASSYWVWHMLILCASYYLAAMAACGALVEESGETNRVSSRVPQSGLSVGALEALWLGSHSLCTAWAMVWMDGLFARGEKCTPSNLGGGQLLLALTSSGCIRMMGSSYALEKRAILFLNCQPHFCLCLTHQTQWHCLWEGWVHARAAHGSLPPWWVGEVLVLLVLSAHWGCCAAGGSRGGLAVLILNHRSVCFSVCSQKCCWLCCPLRSAWSFSEHGMERFLFLLVCIF